MKIKHLPAAPKLDLGKSRYKHLRGCAKYGITILDQRKKRLEKKNERRALNGLSPITSYAAL